MPRSHIVRSMLGQRRRRWTNIDLILVECLVFAGMSIELPKTLPVLSTVIITLIGNRTSVKHQVCNYFVSNKSDMSKFQPLEAVLHGRET